MQVLHRGAPGYEIARRAAVANARAPDREPDAIARPVSTEEVAAAVRQAADHGWRIDVRSGGHSWSGSHLRNGGLLIDLSGMTGVRVDAHARTAVAQPGLRSSELARILAAHELFFPTGHCIGPGLGGFLLQGGFGWNSRRIGPACMSVTAIEVVTADGQVRRADADQNPELLWAARGAGPGFFGVVTAFELALDVRPAGQLASRHVYGPEHLEELMRWVHAVGPDVPDTIELMVFMRRGLLGHPGPGLQLLAPALADSPEQAREDLALLGECPLRAHALEIAEYEPADVVEMVAGTAELYPSGHRYAVDNMWTHASVDDLLPGYHRILDTLPDSPSHAMWMNWRPPARPRPDMAFSLEDDIYLGLYGIWADAARDQEFVPWAETRMRELEPLSSGIQLADENLGRRPAPFMSDDNHRRLEEIRSRYDPERRFHSWMGAAS